MPCPLSHHSRRAPKNPPSHVLSYQHPTCIRVYRPHLERQTKRPTPECTNSPTRCKTPTPPCPAIQSGPRSSLKIRTHRLHPPHTPTPKMTTTHVDPPWISRRHRLSRRPPSHHTALSIMVARRELLWQGRIHLRNASTRLSTLRLRLTRSPTFRPFSLEFTSALSIRVALWCGLSSRLWCWLPSLVFWYGFLPR